jgi:hypothetical protein
MDTLAKLHWQTVAHTSRLHFDLPPTTEWSVWHRNRRLTSWSDKVALQLIHAKPTQSYWTKTQHIPQTNQPVAWDALYQAYKSTPLQRKLWIPKWLSAWLAIGKNLVRWKITQTDVCPRCGEPERRRHHVIQCPQDEAQHTWQALLNKLDRWLTNNYTQYDLHGRILEGLSAWHDDRPPTQPMTSNWPDVEQTLHDQQTLGWHLFFDGFITHSWMATQQSYLEFLSKKTTGKRWLSRLIMQMWEIAWDMWRHRMKIVDTIDSQALIAQMAALDIQVQERFDGFHDTPIPAM